jgi:KaiC/GvpD/RAD55 family RecA-like ATPase
MDKDDKIPTGVEGLDEVLNGGLKKGHMVLMSGAPGSGKTIIGLNFIYEGAIKGEKGLIISFEESEKAIIETAMRFGWNFKPLIKKKLIKIVSIDIRHVNKDLFLAQSGLIEEFKKFCPDRLLVDSISTIELIADPMPEIKKALYEFIKYFKCNRCTSLLISEMHSSKESTALSIYGIEEYMMDGLIYLSFTISEAHYNRLLFIAKMRRSTFIEGGHNYVITDKGIKVYPRKESIW